MIFLGDFVYPFDKKMEILQCDNELFNEEKCLNLEGAIIDHRKYTVSTNARALHSSMFAYDIMQLLNVKAVSLSNNHILDYIIDIEEQKSDLRRNGIVVSGAGDNISSSLVAGLVEDGMYKYALLSFGWNVAGCQYATENKQGVAPLLEDVVVDAVSDTKSKYPDRKVIVNVHWNYVSEYYPQPADRRLAFCAIDAGADAVIGHHPHIVGVYENYKRRPIFYSIGNFFMPSDMGLGTKAKTVLGVKYEEDIADIVLYWMENDSDILKVILTEKLEETNKLEDISGLYQENLIKYTRWFKKNRRKRKILPIFKIHDQSLKSKLLFEFLKIRNYIVYQLTTLGLRKRNN